MFPEGRCFSAAVDRLFHCSHSLIRRPVSPARCLSSRGSGFIQTSEDKQSLQTLPTIW